MEKQVRQKIAVCDRADDAEWADVIAGVAPLTPAQRAFLHEHPPGLVRALWRHFEANRGRCGCESATHEQPDCAEGLIERLLLEEETA